VVVALAVIHKIAAVQNRYLEWGDYCRSSLGGSGEGKRAQGDGSQCHGFIQLFHGLLDSIVLQAILQKRFSFLFHAGIKSFHPAQAR
jgi:hypothetical protein